MAYANKYVIPFVDIENNPCAIYILVDGFEGAETELTPASLPCLLSYNGNVNNKIEPIITSNLNFGIVKLVGDDFSEFRTTNEDYRVELYKDYGTGYELEWKGILIPDSYQEELQYPPIEVRLSAVCGLSRLKFYNYQVESFDLGTTYIAKQVGIKLIATYLSEIFTKADNETLGMEYFYSFFEFVGKGNNPIDDYAVNSFEHRYKFDAVLAYDNNGKAMTYYQLLEEICKFQQARCFQYKGEYYIISVPLYTSTYYGVEQAFETAVENLGGVVETTTCGADFLREFYTQQLPLNKNDITDGSYVEHIDLAVEKSYGNDFHYALKDQIISYQSGIRNAQVTSKIDRGGPTINNFSFDTWLSTDSVPLAWIDESGGDLIRSEYSGVPANSNYEEQGSLISVGIDASNFTTTVPSSGDPYTLLTSLPTVIGQAQKLKIRIWHYYSESIDTGVTINLPFVIRVGDKYARPISGGSSWTSTPYIWNIQLDQTYTPEWGNTQYPSSTSTSFFTNVDLGGPDFLVGMEIGFYRPYVSGGTLSVLGVLRIDDVQMLTPESQGLFQEDRTRLEAVNEWGAFAFNNDNITGKIKYTDFDFLSSSVIDKDSNNDITLMLTTMPPSNVRKSFYIKGANKGFIFPNDYPAGGLVIDDASTILAYEPSGWARFSNQGEFQASDGFDFYFLYMLDLFRLYEKTMQVFQGTLYPQTASSQYSIINTLVDSVNNDGVILLPSKLEIDYKNCFTKIDAFEIQGTDKSIGFITLPIGNYIPPNDPDTGGG